jgi:hypothetical protein
LLKAHPFASLDNNPLNDPWSVYGMSIFTLVLSLGIAFPTPNLVLNVAGFNSAGFALHHGANGVTLGL